MPSALENPPEQSTVSLVTGIVDDMQTLVKQQIQLTRKEIHEEVRKASEAAVLYAIGGAISFLGVVILGFCLVHLVHWAATPVATDLARIPLWACHAIVGGPLLVVGGLLIWWARQTLGSIHPLDNPATEALKDNVKWATNSK